MNNTILISRLASLMTILALLPACRSTATRGLDLAATSKIDAATRDMADSIARDLAADGPNAWVRYFDDSPNFFMAVDGNLQFSNLEQAREFMPKFSAGVAHLSLVWTNLRVYPIANGTAMMGSSFREVFVDKAYHTNEIHGYFTGLAVETGSGWKLRNLHWSMAGPVQ